MRQTSPGILTRRTPPPLYRRVLINVPGFGWRTGYFAEYQGRRRAMIDGVKGHWWGKYWSPLLVATDAGAIVEAV